ncbi:hypothetical protein GPZ77_34355 (plasmid) [Streptomyces sp. QHH-9511]|nr:hypothetical protein GPZ77_34355 [Streptomyces sp. QHH-9511]
MPRSGEPADHALGRSRGGLSAKVHLAAEAVHDHWRRMSRGPSACMPTSAVLAD